MCNHGRARIAMIVNVYYEIFARNQTILDVGCGEGAMYDAMSQEFRSRYTGIDISDVAIQRAKRRRPEGNFIRAKAEEFNLNSVQKYGMIVFNEVLYYTEYKTTLLRYKNFLIPNGYIAISVYRSKAKQSIKNNKAIFSTASNLMHQVDSMDISGRVRSRELDANFKVALYQ